MKLYCFPYAGGSARIYYPWSQHIPASVELCPVELPGRGTLMELPLCQSMSELVEFVYRQIHTEIRSKPFAFYGHSMGGSIAYELSHYIWERNGILPQQLFLSGRRPPHLKRKQEPIYNLPDVEFKNKLIDLEGTPAELLENDQFFELFEPILRADFKIAETYQHTSKKRKLDVPFTVLTGMTDSMSTEDMQEWENYTSGSCDVHVFEGGHFFIHNHTEKITNLVQQKLTATKDSPFQMNRSNVQSI